MDFRTKLKQVLELAKTEIEPIDILPLCREHISEFNELKDQAIEWDLPYITFTQGYLGLTHASFSLHPSSSTNIHRHIILTEDEPDYVVYQMRFNTRTPSIGFLQRILAIILLSDCTNCCNALEAIKIDSQGLIAHGNISMTYHS